MILLETIAALLAATAAGQIEATPLNDPSTRTGSPLVREVEAERVATIEKITPATIAVFNQPGDNGGSGVIVSADGHALTNYHVVAPCGPFMLCGLPDGSLIDAVLVGLDPTGDIALIRLLEEREYPHATIGDSAKAAVGDEVFVVGNPFMLADDFQPTVTHGVLSGVRRYQYPADGVLEYADCLQTDAAINPGNSGGPLYDRDGKLIGINGRASFEKRGRVNVGVGYAVSINQVMRFVEQLKTGRVVDHGALGATARTTADGRVLIDAIDSDSDAYRRGLRFRDRVLAVDGRPIGSANALMNAVATRPAGWRTRITYRNDRGVQNAWVRLEPRHAVGELEQVVEQGLAKQADERPPQTEATTNQPETAELYRHRPGYANFAVARQATLRLLASCPHREGPAVQDAWRLTFEDADKASGELLLDDDRSEATLPSGRSWVDVSRPFDQQPQPPGSGGLLVALHAWRWFLLSDGPDLRRLQAHGPTPWGNEGKLANRIVANLNGARIEFYLNAQSHKLIAIEAWLDDAWDPCRVEFSGFGSGPAPLGSDAPGSLMMSRGDRLLQKWKLTGMLTGVIEAGRPARNP